MSLKYKVESKWKASYQRVTSQPLVSSLGAAAGLGAGEFFGELTSQLLGWMKYKKAAAKTAVKALIGILFFAASPMDGGVFTIPAAVTSWGSTVLDWIAAQWTGGVVGWAQRLAVRLRKLTVASKIVSKEISRLEEAEIPVAPETPPARTVERQKMDGYGRYRNSIGAGRRF